MKRITFFPAPVLKLIPVSPLIPVITPVKVITPLRSFSFRSVTTLLLAALVCLSLAGCSKGSNPPPPSQPNPPPGNLTPVITSISPVSGPAGTPVTLGGANFNATAANNTVKFNGVAATVSSASENSLVATAPATGTTGNITITTTTGTSNGITYTYIAAPAGPDIYVAGINEKSVQGYYKNSTFVPMPDCSTVYAIAGSGSDVYLAGPHSSNAPTYWKNGTAVNLENSVGYTNAVTVSGSDIYTAGAVNGKPKYWMNSTGYPLPAPNGGVASSVFISGSDVYVAGYEVGAGYLPWKASFWKNGAVVELTAGLVGNAAANSIFVAGSDVYVVGYEQEKVGEGIVNVAPRCWKNGTVVPLAIPANNLYNNATCVLVSGTDVYVGGQYNNTGAVWKNGTMINVSGYAVVGSVTSIILYNGDLYISGTTGSTGLTGYWKNTAFTEMDPGCGKAGTGCAGTSATGAAGIYVH